LSRVRRAYLLVLLSTPLFLVARALNAIFGRDPLRRRRAQRASYWIERDAEPPAVHGYFSEASAAEGRGHGGFGRLPAAALIAASRLLRPARRRGAPRVRAGRADIPDEIYTLW
jgi:hypothetical protein